MSMAEIIASQQYLTPKQLIITDQYGNIQPPQEEPPAHKKRKPRKLPKVLSKQQVEALFAEINVKCPTGLRNRALCETLYGCGLRVSEVCNLKPADVDKENGYILVQEGKGGKDRYVPLDDKTTAWLERWEAIRPESEYFFCTLRGDKMGTEYIRQVLDRLSKRSGVYIQAGDKKKHVTPHMLRHTYASELEEEGFAGSEIQELLGHSDLSTTSVYLHVRPQKLAAKIQARER